MTSQQKSEDAVTTQHLIGLLVCVALGIAFSWWITAFGFALIIFDVNKRLKTEANSSATTNEKDDASSTMFSWPANGNFLFDIVGESHYQPAIKSLAGNHGDHEPNVYCEAILTPDDNNAHDEKAVIVKIDGWTVGHLSREDARSFRRRLAAKQLKGMSTKCRARIVGGWINKAGQRMSYGIQLDIKPFD